MLKRVACACQKAHEEGLAVLGKEDGAKNCSLYSTYFISFQANIAPCAFAISLNK